MFLPLLTGIFKLWVFTTAMLDKWKTQHYSEYGNHSMLYHRPLGISYHGMSMIYHGMIATVRHILPVILNMYNADIWGFHTSANLMELDERTF
ncbi:hypothetical protein CEXT_756641 [Caerostris extrusa]|uniref:Uncharacterized protein n=1 Tax=Caerostris extrusa TaxID=172846 RepID=A0AAV4PZA7_CAEEX|nr:hypothetical protein CEXT_756641 [Caerostris extrusa]